MQNRWLRVYILAGIIAMAGLDLLSYYPHLPQRMAVHFNAAGHANGWASKEGFVAIYLGTLLVLTAMFVGLARGLRKLPASLINLPNKVYWLAPERREATLTSLANWLQWMGIATLLFVMLIFHLTLMANLQPQPVLPRTFWPAFTGYLIFVAIWVVLLYRRFNKPPPRSYS
ncbi:MAG: DUF1648 domain-containing protein [Calditrichaeota bacterium]|nr:MAG: DUF1648 domain-containing protein [Calditrichota bacterium]